MISSISLTDAASATNTSDSNAARTKSANDTIDQQEFLMLFLSQLQNQDPTNPLDANGLTEQLAQFSSLEQLFNINTRLEDLGTLLNQREADPLSFLATEVSIQGETVTVKEGEANALTLDIPAGATSVEVMIVGPAGNAVRQVDLGPQPAGEMEFIFDGENANGARVPDGSYTAQVTARDSGGAVLPVETFVRGTVTGVDLTTEPPVLMVGSDRVSLADVREVRAPGGEGT